MDPIQVTLTWLRAIVIKMGLCPFAYEADSKGKILFRLHSFEKAEDILSFFSSTVEQILDSSSKETTALLIIEKGLESFEEYLDVYYSLEAYVENTGLSNEIQLASFHPAYQFSGTQPSDAENYTNRSPLPLIHILNVEEVKNAIASHPDIHQIPLHNIALMKKLGQAGIKEIYSKHGLPNIG